MTTQYERPTGEDTVAGLAQEIRLLVDMVIEHSAPWLEGLVSAGHGPGAGTNTGAWDEQRVPGHDEAAYNCGWCPLCAVVAMVRGDRPEFSARAFDQAAQIVALLRAVLADRWYPEAGMHMPGFRPQESQQGAHGQGSRQAATVETTMPMPKIRPDSQRVQRIAVRKVGARDDARPEE